MFRKAALAAFSAALFVTGAQAGVYADDLTKCLVRSASPADQTDLVKWVFAAMAMHPDVKPYAKFTEAEHAALTKKASDLMIRLITVDCHTESVAAIKYEGAPSFEESFKVLGEVAFRGLMSDPNVMQGMSGLETADTKAKMQAIMQEAGAQTEPSPQH